MAASPTFMYYSFTQFTLLQFAASSANYIRSKTFEGTCPLHLSASRGNLECTAILLESGADPNEVTNDATTPLFLGEYIVIKKLRDSRDKIPQT